MGVLEEWHQTDLLNVISVASAMVDFLLKNRVNLIQSSVEANRELKFNGRKP